MKFLDMERRQKYIEEILKRQQKHIFKISKELELHREFLGLQFESFMDFLFQNGGQVIQLSGRNGVEDETGVFFPMKSSDKGESQQTEDDLGSDEGEDGENSQHPAGNEGKDNSQLKSNEDGTREDEMVENLPPPQAVLGSHLADDSGVASSVDKSLSNTNRSLVREEFRGQSNSSRRSSNNVVSSSDPHNGDDDDYEDGEEYDGDQPEVMKYDMNHFMFSHFMDGGQEENEMEESYNDNDEELGMYDDEDTIPPVDQRREQGTSRQWPNHSVGRNSNGASNTQQISGNCLPLPSNNMPHNERTCRYCGKTFHWKQSWVIHERTHTGEKPYLCKCGKAFSQKSNMNTHAKSCAQAMTTQKGKTTVFQMKCSHCQKMFSHKKNLDLHMEKFHPEILNLSVKPSSSSSSPSSSSFHNGASSAAALLEAAAAAQKAAENAAILQILRNASAQASNNINNNSDEAGARSGSLSPSMNHTSNSNGSISGEDRNGRYPCPYCHKRFPVKGTLERHIRVHTGEKPFLCGICGKAFTQKGSVKLHLERVHRQIVN